MLISSQLQRPRHALSYKIIKQQKRRKGQKIRALGYSSHILLSGVSQVNFTTAKYVVETFMNPFVQLIYELNIFINSVSKIMVNMMAVSSEE